MNNNSVIMYAVKTDDFLLPDYRKEGRRTKTAPQPEYEAFALNPAFTLQSCAGKYYLRTYGCQANVRDSETLAGILAMMGYVETADRKEADILIFNTCAVRRSAEEHVLGEIGALKSLKKSHPEKIIALCGCMPQQADAVKEILDKYPQVDLIFGTHNLYRFPELVNDCLRKKKRVVEIFSEEGRIIENLPVIRGSQCKGFVNIMYGCDKFCTYCIVPYTRGKERSRRKEDIISEVKDLMASGRKEVTLLGQNVNAYGRDLGRADGFTDLLISIAETGIERIRFYTSHPRDYSSATIEAMKRYPNIMKSLHLPVQSGDNMILKKMNRGYTVESYKELYDQMKSRIPEITFTTDLIVGFPGETDEQFRHTLELVDYCRFDLAYTFVYSPRSHTPAAMMFDDTPPEVKKERLAMLNEKVNAAALANNRKYMGRTVKVLCEGLSKKNKTVLTGYSEENKLVNFRGYAAMINHIVEVEITDTHSFTLDGIAVEKH